MKAYDTPTLDVEWFTAQTALSRTFCPLPLWVGALPFLVRFVQGRG